MVALERRIDPSEVRANKPLHGVTTGQLKATAHRVRDVLPMP